MAPSESEEGPPPPPPSDVAPVVGQHLPLPPQLFHQCNTMKHITSGLKELEHNHICVEVLMSYLQKKKNFLQPQNQC